MSIKVSEHWFVYIHQRKQLILALSMIKNACALYIVHIYCPNLEKIQKIIAGTFFCMKFNN